MIVDNTGFRAKVRAEIEVKHLESMDKVKRDELIGEAFFLCPSVFRPGNDPKKYMPVMAYWLTRGCMAHVIRDKFTSGGTKEVHNLKVAQVIHRAGVRHREDIMRASQVLTEEQISTFWDINDLPPREQLITRWLVLVKENFDGTDEEYQVLEKCFTSSGHDCGGNHSESETTDI